MTAVTSPRFLHCLVAFPRADDRKEVLKNIEEAMELYSEDVKAAGEPIPIEDEREYVEVSAGTR